VLRNPFGLATTIPLGILSLKYTPPSVALGLGFETVKVRLVVPFNGILAAPKVLPINGVVAAIPHCCCRAVCAEPFD
jgi:hypothetical protein